MDQVASDEGRSAQGDAGDEQVGSTDAFQVLDLPKAVELDGRPGVEGNDHHTPQLALGLIQPRLGRLELDAFTGLEQKGETPLQDFNAADDRLYFPRFTPLYAAKLSSRSAVAWISAFESPGLRTSRNSSRSSSRRQALRLSA